MIVGFIRWQALQNIRYPSISHNLNNILSVIIFIKAKLIKLDWWNNDIAWQYFPYWRKVIVIVKLQHGKNCQLPETEGQTDRHRYL